VLVVDDDSQNYVPLYYRNELDWERADPVLVHILAKMRHPDFPEPIGVFRSVEREIYEDQVREQIDSATDRRGDGGECPQCAHSLVSRGQQTRSLATNYNQSISLKRSYGFCPACGAGLFPPG